MAHAYDWRNRGGRMTKAKRAKLPRSEFGIPSKRGFPMNDPKHQRLAISGATRSYNAGNISKGTEERIQSEARAKLKRSK